MKKLHTFSFNERALAGMYRDLLEREGVSCLLRNDELSSALGEIPFIECYPELWVIDDEIYPRAKCLLTQWMENGSEQRPPWTCPECGEPMEGQFNACWQCSHPRPND